jgi:hypothetical protein
MFTKRHTYCYRTCDQVWITNLLMQGIICTQDYAARNGYRLIGDLPSEEALHAGVARATQTQRKRLIKQAESLKKRPGLRTGNQFLHSLCTKLLAYAAPLHIAHITYSEKETAIQVARKAWVKARDQAEALRLAYLTEKGNFYTGKA